MTTAAADLADELSPAPVSMNLVAERLGVKAPSLYKHVDGLADLLHRVAILSAIELGDAIRDSVQGRAGRGALVAAAQAVRTYVKEHPGRYAATVGATPTGPEDPLTAALDRTAASFAATLRGYGLSPDGQVHAIRMLRSALQGFAALEAGEGFQRSTSIDDSFLWMIDLIDHGLTTERAVSTALS